MINDLLLHQQTRTDLNRFIARPAHALLLIGELGMGKGTVARELANHLLAASGNRIPGERLREMRPIKGTFTIDQVRDIQQFVKLKSVAGGNVKRVILLHDTHLMNIEAQNALLKLLEEPPLDTVLIMTSVPGDVLLPTIYSRLQKIQIHIPDEQASNAFFANQRYSSEDIKKMYTLSGGHTGLLKALLNDNTDHPLVSAIERAKTILTSTRNDKMKTVDSLSKSREETMLFLQATKRIILAALEGAAQQDRESAVQRWYTSLQLIQHSEEIYKTNPNSKLLLTHIMLNV